MFREKLKSLIYDLQDLGDFIDYCRCERIHLPSCLESKRAIHAALLIMADPRERKTITIQCGKLLATQGIILYPEAGMIQFPDKHYVTLPREFVDLPVSTPSLPGVEP